MLGGAFLIASALYATLIIRAYGNPPISWGDPRTLENLWWLVSGELYRGYLFGLPLSQYPAQISALAKLLFDQFGLVGVALGLWGATELFRQSRRLASALAVAFGLQMLFAIGYYSRDSYIYLIPGFMIFSLWIAVGLHFLVNQLTNYLAHRGMRAQWHLPAVSALLLLLPATNLVANFSAMDLSQDTRALEYGKQVFAAVPDNAVIIADGDEHIFALWYYRYVEKPNSRVAVIAKGLAGYAWYRDILRREYPEWTWSESGGLPWDQFLQTLVTSNQRRYSFFWTDADPRFESVFRFQRVGLLYEVSPMGPK
ncbi:MAG: hypothetical protein HY327_12220 [Chloroflexi bacterium]|nr:hypothetical protein [Chloroflexota bacterium]